MSSARIHCKVPNSFSGKYANFSFPIQQTTEDAARGFVAGIQHVCAPPILFAGFKDNPNSKNAFTICELPQQYFPSFIKASISWVQAFTTLEGYAHSKCETVYIPFANYDFVLKHTRQKLLRDNRNIKYTEDPTLWNTISEYCIIPPGTHCGYREKDIAAELKEIIVRFLPISIVLTINDMVKQYKDGKLASVK